MRKPLKFVLVGMVVLFAAVGIYAATEVPDVIKMENKAYDKHKKGIVAFSHKKHSDAYAKTHPEFYKNGCGECHHDDQNKPLSNLKAGDDVQSCLECHKKLGEMPSKEKKNLMDFAIFPRPNKILFTNFVIILLVNFHTR